MPHKPRKGVPFFDEEQEEEAYCAAPFNMNAPDVEAPLPTAFTEDGEEVTGLHLLLCSMIYSHNKFTFQLMRRSLCRTNLVSPKQSVSLRLYTVYHIF